MRFPTLAFILLLGVSAETRAQSLRQDTASADSAAVDSAAGRRAQRADTIPPAGTGGNGAATASPADSKPRNGVKSDLLLPLVSVILPGFGQYCQAEPLAGAAYTGGAVAGLAFYLAGNAELAKDSASPDDPSVLDYPHDYAEKKFILGAQTVRTAGFLSAYHTFRSSVPAFQREEGEYLFLRGQGEEEAGDLLRAPFRFDFLKRPTTYIPLGLFTGLVVWAVSVERGDHRGADWTYRWDDAPFVAAVSYNAGVGEEAAFRGYLLPWSYQFMGRNWLPANGSQALLFAAAHYGSDLRFPVVQGLLGYYWGYLVRRNRWTLSESIFQHFWWDAIAFMAGYLAERREEARIGFSAPIAF